MRLTKKCKDGYCADADYGEVGNRITSKHIITKLGKLEDLMEKHEIETIEELEDTIKLKRLWNWHLENIEDKR